MTNDRIVNQELYELLCLIDVNDLHKIPEDILNHIADNRDENYETKIDISDFYNPNNVLEETYSIFYKLYFEYILTDEEKKEITD